jgi:molybdopterin/thiamine biosynthesis adenylyltransferase
MTPLVKITRPLLLRALEDLERPHSFAGERLGFFSFRQALHEERPLLLCYDYHPIPDGDYIPDTKCGGRIGVAAIRAAMGRSFREMAGQLWVHTHGRCGHPRPSSTDLKEGPNILRSLANAQPATLQAWGILSEDGIYGQIQTLDSQVCEFSDLTVVGWPMVIPSRSPLVAEAGWLTRAFRRPKASTRHARQGFLGPHAQQIVESAKIGIVGLGGGGSHINQQLAHIGFQRFVLCDEDRVERSNLNRLVGATLQDAKRRRYKVEVARKLIRKLQRTAVIDDRPLRWEEKRSSLRECDLIFGSIDSFTGRRDLEAFCRAHMIPFVDIGMKVLHPENPPAEICGQAIVSMPGEPCMHCMQFLTAENMAAEAQDYNAGPQAQVVWPNGILASTAVGYGMALLTGWSGVANPGRRLDYRGSQMCVSPSNLAAALGTGPCRHFPLPQCGDPVFKKV